MKQGCLVLLALLVVSLLSANAQFDVLGPQSTPYVGGTVNFVGSDGKTLCKACEIKCSDILLFQPGSCKQDYYYYGCNIETPCVTANTADSYQFNAAVAFCAANNLCKFEEYIQTSFDYALFYPLDTPDQIIEKTLQNFFDSAFGAQEKIIVNIENVRTQLETKARQFEAFCKVRQVQYSKFQDKLAAVRKSCANGKDLLDDLRVSLTSKLNLIQGGKFSFSDFYKSQYKSLKATPSHLYVKLMRDRILFKSKPSLPPSIYLYFSLAQDFKTFDTYPREVVTRYKKILPAWFKNVISYYDLTKSDYDGIRAQLKVSGNGKTRIDTLLDWVTEYSRRYSVEFYTKNLRLLELQQSIPTKWLGYTTTATIPPNVRVEIPKDIYSLLVERNSLLDWKAAFDLNIDAAYREELKKFTDEAVVESEDLFNSKLVNAKDIFFLPPSNTAATSKVQNIELDRWKVRRGSPYAGKGRSPLSHQSLKDGSLRTYASNEQVAPSSVLTVQQGNKVNSVVYCDDRVLVYHPASGTYLTATNDCDGTATVCAKFKPMTSMNQIWLFSDCQGGVSMKTTSPFSLRSEAGSFLSIEGSKFALALQPSSATTLVALVTTVPSNERANIADGFNFFITQGPDGAQQYLTLDNNKLSMSASSGTPSQVFQFVKVGTLTPEYVEGVTDDILRCGDTIVIGDIRGRYMTIDSCESRRECIYWYGAQPRNQKFVIEGCTGTETLQSSTKFYLRGENGKYFTRTPNALYADSVQNTEAEQFRFEGSGSVRGLVSVFDNKRVTGIDENQPALKDYSYNFVGTNVMPLKLDFSGDPKLKNIGCSDVVTINVPGTDLYMTESDNSMISFSPMQKKGQTWVVGCDTDKKTVNFEDPIYLLAESTTGIYCHNNGFRSLYDWPPTWKLISYTATAGTKVKDLDTFFLFNHWCQTAIGYKSTTSAMDAIKIGFSEAAKGVSKLKMLKVGGLVSIYNRRVEQKVFCGDRIMIRSNGKYLTATSDGSVSFVHELKHGQSFQIVGCKEGFPLTQQSQVRLQTEYDIYLTASDKLSAKDNGDLFTFKPSTSSLEDDTSVPLSVNGKFVSGTATIVSLAVPLEILKIRKTSAVVYEHEQRVDLDIINSNDRVTIRDENGNYLTENADKSLSFAPNQESAQTWKVSVVGASQGAPVRPGDIITLASESGKAVTLSTSSKFIERPMDKTRHFVRDGDVITLVDAQTQNYITSLDNKMDVSPAPTTASQLQFNKVGSNWCSFYVENYVRRKNMQKRLMLDIDTVDTAWITIGEQEQIVLPTITCCGTKSIDLSSYFTNSNERIRIAAYNSQKCTSGHLRLALREENFPYQSLQAYNRPTFYILHRNREVRVATISNMVDSVAATFSLVPGLGDNSNCVSFESQNLQRYYLRRQGTTIYLEPFVDTAQFRNDATFCTKPGLADETYSSFVSYTDAQSYLRNMNGMLQMAKDDGSDAFKNDATWKIAEQVSKDPRFTLAAPAYTPANPNVISVDTWYFSQGYLNGINSAILDGATPAFMEQKAPPTTAWTTSKELNFFVKKVVSTCFQELFSYYTIGYVWIPNNFSKLTLKLSTDDMSWIILNNQLVENDGCCYMDRPHDWTNNPAVRRGQWNKIVGIGAGICTTELLGIKLVLN